MKTKTFFISVSVLLGLAAVAAGTFFLGRLLPDSGSVSAAGDPPLSRLDLSPQTVNGITAQIESYYVDANRLAFVVRIDGEGKNYSLDNISLQKAGREIEDSSEVQSLSDEDARFSVELVTTSPLEEERLDGQFAFTVFAGNGEDPPLADFKFDLDLPMPPTLIFNPKQSVSANGVEILLDRLIITPAFTQVYLCYVPPTDADWGIGGDSKLEVNTRIGSMETYSLLFDDKLADGTKGGEPGWTPPVKVGRCVKIGFPVGEAHPQSITLTIPALEQTVPEAIPAPDLAAAYQKLNAEGIDLEWHQVDHGAYMEYKKLPAGMTQEEAFRHFVRALGYIYPGEWKFEVSLDK